MSSCLEVWKLPVPVLLDGAWGTQLQRRGLPVGMSSETWNLSQPDQVAAVAKAYVEAGSDIILTNTFCGNRFMLERHGLADRTEEINRRGAELSVAAARGWARVFGSMGPTGKMVMMGEVDEATVRAVYTEQAHALRQGGVDGIVVETMADLEEAKLAVQAAKTTGLPVAASMVYDSGADKDHTMMGVSPEQAAEGLAEAGADIVGANCGQGPAGYLPICRRLRAATGLPLWIKPNAGMPELVDGKPFYRMPPATFAEVMEEMVAAGATLIGGCCGTSPEFIQALKQRRKG